MSNVNPKEFAEFISGENDDFTLNNAYEIEDVLRVLKDLDKKVDFLKGLKKHRNEQIDAEISGVATRMDRLRSIVLKTMKTYEPNQKTLYYPAVGKVTRRDVKESWDIEDEEALLLFLEGKGRRSEAVKTKEVLDSKSAKILVESFVEQGEVVPGVKKIDARESISISFDDKENESKDKPKKRSSAKSVKTESKQDLEDLDELKV